MMVLWFVCCLCVGPGPVERPKGLWPDTQPCETAPQQSCRAMTLAVDPNHTLARGYCEGALAFSDYPRCEVYRENGQRVRCEKIRWPT